MIILKNATLMPQSGEDFVGDIAFEGKKIVKTAKNIQPSAADIVYDMTGKYITPGFIDAHSHIGMFEDGMASEGNDGNEASSPSTPNVRAIDGVNPFDPCFRESYTHGITCVMTGPGSANVLGGQFVLMNTYGNCVEDMMVDTKVNNPAAMKAAFGENPKRVYGSRTQLPITRMGTAAVMRESLAKAKEYMEKKEAAKDNPEKAPALDVKHEALIPVLKRELPLKIHAHRADDILTAVRIANEFNIKFTLDHFTEGYMIADLIKKELSHNLIGVIIGPLLSDRSKIELKNLSFGAAKVLYEAGIPFAMMTDCPVIPQMYLPVCMSLAVREGLPEEYGLKPITVNAAKILGVDDIMGTLEEGKLANIAVFDGHPLDTRSHCVMTVIEGETVYERK
ncbi:MAG: amidohydrolase [Clostridia bacterium]|nr:amidohydrolase [Clostridia bacterium]